MLACEVLSESLTEVAWFRVETSCDACRNCDKLLELLEGSDGTKM